MQHIQDCNIIDRFAPPIIIVIDGDSTFMSERMDKERLIDLGIKITCRVYIVNDVHFYINLVDMIDSVCYVIDNGQVYTNAEQLS